MSPGRPCRDILDIFFRGRPRPRRARLPGKGGFSPGGILLLWLDLGPLDLHAGPSKLLVSCTLVCPWLVRARVKGKRIPLSVFPDTHALRLLPWFDTFPTYL